MRAIWAHGAAHGVWKDIARRVVGGREETWVVNVEASVISMIVDIAYELP